VRDGLDRNERCLYVVDDSSTQEVKAAMRDAGIDVDDAVETGQDALRRVSTPVR
jgi:KaiC/GvpD/RAD55 family RecA-like ATPase